MNGKKELRIIKGAVRGERNAFDKLMDLKNRRILYIAMNLLSDKEIAEDAAQEAIIRINRSIAGLKDPKLFDTWMYRIVYNTCMDMTKTNKHTTVDIEEYESLFEEERTDFLPEEFMADTEKRSKVLQAIQDLPENYRVCVLMYYYEEMSYADIASVMDIKVKDVSNNLSRAKAKLRCTLLGAADIASESTGKANTAAVGASFAAAPVLTQILEHDAKESISQNTLDYLMKKSAESFVPEQAPNILAAFISTVSGKIIIAGLTVAATISAGIMFGGFGGAEPVNFTQDMPIEQPTALPEFSSIPEKSEEPASQVLPEEQAEQLETVSQQYAQIDQDEWQTVITEAALEYAGETVDQSYGYRIYIKDNQQTGYCLMTIERIADQGVNAVVYNVVPKGTTLPERSQIVDAFKAWGTS